MISINHFQEIRSSIHSGTNVNEVLETVAKKATEVVNGRGAIVRIIMAGSKELGPSAAYGMGKRYLSKGFLSRLKTITDLYQLNKIVIIDDILNDHRVQHRQEVWGDGIRMMVDVPLGYEKKIVGIIRVYIGESRELKKEELNFLVTCATCGACAIEKARLFETQQLEYDQLATQTEKLSALGRMAAGIAHEINNPLAGILLYSTNLLKRAPKSGPMREGLEIIVHETQRCGNIIQELLEFSREGEPDKALVDINNVIEKALSILENEFRLHHIDVQKRLSDGMDDILLDANQIEQVFVNLLLNAIEAIQDRGVVTIISRVGSGGDSIVVEVEDTGGGISSEHLPKIFEPFFSSKANGTGLGLAVSYGIVQKHQGHIYVSSHAGRGTRFTIELPLQHSTVSK
jgi:signal transduction histidine kinase